MIVLFARHALMFLALIVRLRRRIARLVPAVGRLPGTARDPYPWNPLRPPDANGNAGLLSDIDRSKTTKGRHMARELAAGDKAPAFTLAGDDGASVSLKDFKTRNLVLYF